MADEPALEAMEISDATPSNNLNGPPRAQTDDSPLQHGSPTLPAAVIRERIATGSQGLSPYALD